MFTFVKQCRALSLTNSVDVDVSFDVYASLLHNWFCCGLFQILILFFDAQINFALFLLIS